MAANNLAAQPDPAALAELARALVAALPKPVNLEIELWSVDEIAAYLKRSPSHVRQRICPRPGFPDPIRLPGTSQGLWPAREVIDWALAHRERRAA